jgi:predicted HTH transcriptional regulator
MRILQRQETETLELLGSMVRQQQLERVGRGRQSLFQLSAEAAASLAVPAFGRFLTPTELENRVLTYAQNHGQITNRDCRRVCGLSADQASRLLARLARTGQLQATGSKRGRAYLPVSG